MPPKSWAPLTGDTAIDISGKTVVTVSGASAWTWANGFFDSDGIDTGRIIVLLNTDGGLTIPASMVGNLSADYTMAAGEAVTLMYDGSTWQILGKPPGISKTLTWYGATTSGGAVDTQFSITITNGIITAATP